MKNVAPAIFPPNGIGDARSSNQAVLDWVDEIAKLTEPENIFWCDGSERENDFLIGESLNQNFRSSSIRRRFRVRICIAPIQTTSHESSNSPSSARRRRKKPAPPIIGLSREKRTRNFANF